jgi:iron complex transport system ATP-binding protein
MSLEIVDLSFGYSSKQTVLENISFGVEANEFVCIAGPNGTGKTTLLKCVNRILRPNTGQVILGENDITNWGPQDIAKVIAYVPQYNNTLRSMSVFNAVMMGRLPHAQGKYCAQDREIVYSILQKMAIEALAFRDFRQLSGGERQKVMIARALAQQPQVIILDEPTSNLDLKNQLHILKLIASLCQTECLSVMMSIHDLNLAALFADKILMLKDTKIFACGPPNRVLTKETITSIYGVDTAVTLEEGYKHVRLRR